MAAIGSFEAVDSVSSVIGEFELEAVRQTFHIPEEVDMVLPAPGQSIRHPPLGYYGMYTRYFYDGVIFPIPCWITRYLWYLGVPLCQLHPQALRTILTFYYLLRANSQAVYPTVAQIAFCFRAMNGSAPFGGWVTLVQRRELPQLVARPRPLFRWNDRFVFVSENSLDNDLHGNEMTMPIAWSYTAFPNIIPRFPDDFEESDGLFLRLLLQLRNVRASLTDLIARHHPYRGCYEARDWHNRVARMVNRLHPNTVPTARELMRNH